MGDDRGSSNIGYILDALVVMVLLGTIIIYGNPGNLSTSTPQPDSVVALGP